MGANKALGAQYKLLKMGFTEKDLSEVCMIPDCGCDGEPHP